MRVRIFIEGGGSANELKRRCRESFRKLLERSGCAGPGLKLVACGPRDSVFRNFQTAHSTVTSSTEFVAMLLDSEDPVDDIERTWAHLCRRDLSWRKPAKSRDEQVLLMTTCMETWIVADRNALNAYYRAAVQQSALPSLTNIEAKSRQSIQRALAHATRNCTERYKKGLNSFKVLATLDPTVLSQHLPSFRRVHRILNEKR